MPFARTVIHLTTIGSTSDLARELLVAGQTPLPLLVRADAQTAGRGRGSNRWFSGPGSLMITLGLDPAAHGLTDAHQPCVALAAAVALIETLEDLGGPPGLLGIRWPNDVEARDRKLAGLLPERIETPCGVRLALGLGLNVATDLAQAPADIRALATSVSELVGSDYPPAPILGGFLDRIGPTLEALAGDDADLARRWTTRDTLSNRTIRVKLAGRTIEAVGRGIDAKGALVIDGPDGPQSLFGGQILRD
jgi:BirA family biotin operon repressor/biotin-[acetyl-CoA-carboxylase] ligase